MERKTKQRDAIIDALVSENRPLSHQEIFNRAVRMVPNLGIATVYRAVKDYMNSGKLDQVTLPGDVTRFELSGKHHHHHFWCRNCDRLFDVEGCSGQVGLNPPKGFKTESHEIFFKGLCSTCLKS